MLRRDEDGLIDGVPGSAGSAHGLRGRGAAINPGNRFERTRLTVLGEFLDHDLSERAEAQADGTTVPPPVLPTTLYADTTKTVINRVDSPDLPFSWTVNPYRGCEHGCVYCYARPTHETLGWSCGVDFETRIVAKRDAAQLLARELDDPRWKPETIVVSGVTDAYQPIERTLRITRACLEVMAERNQPVAIVTKNRLVTRDIDLLARLARVGAARVAISLTSLDRDVARKMEPRASTPQDRLRAMRELSDAGVPVMVMTAPVVPGLTDHELPRLLEAAAEAGATGAGWVMLRLPHQIKDVFLEWSAREFPERARRIESAVRGMRGGALYTARWGVRHRGEGPIAEQIAANFKVFTRRYGLDRPTPPLSGAAFRRGNAAVGQLSLF